jgi:mannose-6-phosphate isomerase-like protein (cupin superfamily)
MSMIGHVDNSVVINADLDLVWSVTNDVERWPTLFTEYAAAEILDREGDSLRFRLTMHPDENGKSWSWVSERTTDRASRRVKARRVEPGPFEFMDIEWAYAEEAGKTSMRWIQDFKMRPEAPIDTAAMTERINTNTAIQMNIIRAKIERLASGTAADVRAISTADVPANTRRGGDIRTLLSPATVGATSGFLGTLRLEPGELVTEHLHPYSEEFLFCVSGQAALQLDRTETVTISANEGVLIPIGVRHRLVQTGTEPAFFVFHLSPLAPAPHLGHVDTEQPVR